MTQPHAEETSARFGSLPSLGAAFLFGGSPRIKKRIDFRLFFPTMKINQATTRQRGWGEGKI
ncbi:hypothetical protein, partial [Chamaesiphon sp. OTE_8_metabat_110]|uniref:hypothetical protein n=1 Tax=Chamaesiphon sp. OTE_8_metabat_110 TaxID=2964696 RepID=UPI00286CF023